MSVSADWRLPEKRDAGIGADASANAADTAKSKKQLLEEIVQLRQRVRALEAEDRRQSSIEAEPKGTRLRQLLAASPAIIYTTQASGDYRCTFVSENLRAIMGYSPEEMTTDPKTWADHLHPEDAARVLKEMGPLIGRGGGTVEYRFRHRDGHYIWIQDTFRVTTDQTGHASELVGAWADITERKSIETELIGTRQRL
jgi:PAS domain S-box-containing protein